jgi:hypothetical protein
MVVARCWPSRNSPAAAWPPVATVAWAVPPAVPQTTVQCTPAAAHCAVDALACTRPPPRAALPSYSYAPASPFECPTRAVLGAAASRAERPSVSQHRLYVGIAYYIGVK